MPIPLKNNKHNPFSMKALETETEFLLYTDIGMWGITAENFLASVNSCKTKKKKLRVNSYGGEVYDGIAIHNEIKDNSGDWVADIDAIAASSASIVILGAGTVRMRSNARLMIHNPSCIVIGEAEDMEKEAKELRSLENTIIDMYFVRMSKKGWSKEDIKELMKETTYFTAQEALDCGLIDEIIDPIEVEEPETNSDKKIPTNIARTVFTNYKPENKPDTGNQKPDNKGENVMKCPHCGKEHAEGSVFCSSCGKHMDILEAQRAANAKERKEAVIAERERVQNINAACKKYGLSDEFAKELVDSNDEYEKCAIKMLEKISIPDPIKQHRIEPNAGGDASDKFRAHAQNSLQVALKMTSDKVVIEDIRKNPGPTNLHGLVRSCLHNEGKLTDSQIMNLNPHDIGVHAIRMAGIGSSDLPAILADTMNKQFDGAAEETDATFQEFTAVDENPDFRAKSYTKLSSFGDIDDLPEGKAFGEGKFSDKKESISVSTKGKAITITRQMFVNNDTSAIATFPKMITLAGFRRQNMDAYDLLTYNSCVGPVLEEDTKAVFDLSAHDNLIADSGIPSVTSVGAAEGKLLNIKLLKPTPDAKQAYGKATAKYIITGSLNNVNTIRQLINTSFDPKATIPGVYNPYTGLTPIFDPYLQSLLTAAGYGYGFYLAGDQRIWPTLTIAYLSGARTPTLRSEPSGVGEALGIKWDFYWDWGFGFKDWRGIVFNDGVTAEE
ncbi:MAG: head maturation protease, ClpP-related [Candidatus Paceibacterota bacterium]|jgi:ATP-dependent protease ClpP protease subunit